MPAAAFGQDDEVVAESFGAGDEIVGGWGADDEEVTSLSPLQREMASAGVNFGTGGDTARLPQASEDDRLQGFMTRSAAAGMPTVEPETGPERLERLIGYAEHVTSDLANPIRYFARMADIPIDATLNRNRPEFQGATERAVQLPGINLPRAGAAESTAGKAAAGTYNAVADLVAHFSTPEALAMLPAGTSKAVLAGWASQMAAHAPEQFVEAVRLARAGKTQEAWQAAATGGGEALMAWMAGRHAFGERLPRPETEPARGELPDPDTVARNLAAPGTMRPQEIRGAVAPAEAAVRPPEMVQFERVPVFNNAGEVVDVQIRPRIREVFIEEPGVIEPVTRRLKEDVEGGKLGFRRTAEDFIQRRGAEAPRETEVRPNAIQEPSPVALPGKEPAKGIQEMEADLRRAQEPAEARAAPAIGAGQPAAVVPASRPVAAPETITRSGKPENEGTASEILAEREERLGQRPPPSRRRQAADRPWDILDEIEGQVGGKIDPTLIRQLNPDWRPVGAARDLFRIGGRAADVVLNALTYEGPRLGLTKDMGLQEFGEAINTAAMARKGWRQRAAKERRIIDEQAREAQTRSQFEQKVLAGERPKAQQNKVQQVRVDNLVVGDRFRVQNERFEITEMLTDEDGNLVSVTLKDGPKFGVQTVGDVGVIHVDKGTLRLNRKAREFGAGDEVVQAPTISEPAPVAAANAPAAPEAAKPPNLAPEGRPSIAALRKHLFGAIGESLNDYLRTAPREAVLENYRLANDLLDAVNREIFDRQQFGGDANELYPLRYDADQIRASLEHHLMTTKAPEAAKPGLVAGTSAEAWADRTIEQGRQRLQVGIDPELFAAYVVKGAAHLERGVRKFSDWSLKMIAEHGDPIRPHLRRIYEEASAGLGKVRTDEATRKQRKLAIRGSVSPEVAPVHRERLKTGKEAFYEPQDVSRVEDAVTHRTSEELASVPMVAPDGPNNLWVAAQLELYRRSIAAGNLDAGWAIMDRAMKAGTSLGQLVNQFKMLKGATPDGVLVAINRRLQEAGFDPMRPSEQIRTRRLAEESIKRNAEWKEQERVYRDQPTPENFDKVKKSREDAVEADVELQQKIAAYQPRAFWDMATTLLKGNLLAPISQAANVVGNTTNLLIRGGARSTASVVDAVDAFLRSRPRTVSAVPLRGARAATGAVIGAIPDSARSLWKGASDADLSKADVQRGLRPLVALRDLFRSQVEGPQRNGKTPFSQRLLMALEASPFAMHATAQLRLLGAVDKPFRAAARARLITEALKLRDIQRPRGTPSALTADNIRRAVEYPELFLDEATLARIDNEAAYAVYQGRNPVTTRINVALHGAKPATRFFVASLAPYISTPINLIGEWLSYNPAVAGVNAVRQAAKGNSRGVSVAAGKFVAGSMMLAAGYWLYQKGLIAPSLDQQDEQQKARVLAGMTLPPHHINLSGLKRALAGGDPTWQKGDRSIDVLRGGGVAGAMMLSATDVMGQRERQPDAGGADFAARVVGDQWTQMLQYGVNQSFLKGTANLLDAVQEGKMDSWAATYVDTLTAIPMPGTLNAFARATRENKPEVRGDALDERIENQIRSRLGVFGADDKLPFKRDLWGRPIPETPPGNLPWLYHTLDVSKGQRIPTDDAALMLYGLWRKTADNAVIPTPPDANLTIAGRQYQLDREQVSRLQELVGTARKDILDRVMLNDRFVNLAPERKVALLRKVWERGAALGNAAFWRERGASLERKEKPAGFQP